MANRKSQGTRRASVAVLVLAVSAAAASKSSTPSFDCNNAATPDELAICSSDRLSELDRMIASSYSYVRATKGKKFARDLGRPLLRMRQACLHDTDCIQMRQIEAIEAYRAVGAPVTLPRWVAANVPQPRVVRQSGQTRVSTNVNVRNAIVVVQEELDQKALNLLVLSELIAQQKALSESGGGINRMALQVLSARAKSIESDITEIQSSASRKYNTSIRPNNADLDLSAREKSKNFPPVPYYVAGRKGNGEFWLEPVVKDTGELVHKLNFIDPSASNERITATFELTLKEVQQVRQALGKIYEWSETAKKKKIRKRYEKTAVCFPSDQCKAQVTGNTSTQLDFLIYEDGATGARIVRNKGQFAEPYNMSIDSATMLAAYLDFVEKAAREEYDAGTLTDEKMDKMFK